MIYFVVLYAIWYDYCFIIVTEGGESLHIYHCLVKGGHVGSGRFIERRLLIRANNILEAMQKAKGFGGVKKGHCYKNGTSILHVRLVN